MEEAASYHMPHSLRRLFATLLVYFPPANPLILWSKFEQAMYENYNKMSTLPAEQVRLKVLHQISNFLDSMGKDINSFCLVSTTLRFRDRYTIQEIPPVS